MKTTRSFLLMAILTATTGLVHAQATTNPARQSPDAKTPFGTPASSAPGSTGGAHTPGTSASGAAVKCPEATMQAGNDGKPDQGTGRRGPKLAKNTSPTASTSCADDKTATTTSSTTQSSTAQSPTAQSSGAGGTSNNQGNSASGAQGAADDGKGKQQQKR